MFYSLVALVSIGLMSCGKKDDKSPLLGAEVQVTVKNLLGIPQTNTPVYLYKDTEITNSTERSQADKDAITNENGIATFDLNLTQLNIFEARTTLSFAVFYTVGDEEMVAGSASITVKRNEEKKIEITIPI